MNISTIENTLQNYITKYIEQKFAAHTSGNRYDKFYRELLSGIEEVVKLTVSEAKHYDSSLENIYNDLKSHKRLIHTIAKQKILTFLNTHTVKKEIIAGFNNEHSLNESDVKILKEGKDLVDTINDINLLQKNENGEEVNIRKTLAQSIKVPSIEKHKSED
ncbi:hypothetical protein [Wolbachia endosymbiont of Folsomia candida]|uniref:hypothetical protein n=1 Tax=Wolbachia endosymbiont of Folsomia candida TaxID=169402 RepID=UPI000A79C965|nr:hypothetical protein [Wolbachia endosymbiont of Folsomia candida]APR98076.1 hypothetical protein ASM33_02030 [Wolbachia endosymbiont of Folsomia candida]